MSYYIRAKQWLESDEYKQLDDSAKEFSINQTIIKFQNQLHKAYEQQAEQSLISDLEQTITLLTESFVTKKRSVLNNFVFDTSPLIDAVDQGEPLSEMEKRKALDNLRAQSQLTTGSEVLKRYAKKMASL